jgi:hypothetical protein
VEDEIEDARMLELARALASLAMGDDFVPKEFTATAAAKVLIIRNVEPESILRRFVANGILLKKSVGGINIYRFILDPVCETLGAFERALACGADSEKWDKLIDAAAAQSESKGFISALQQVHSRYCEQFKWPRTLRDVSEQF